MRVVSAESEMAAAWRDASSEALNAFGDARLYLEKYVDRPRHIEIQIFGDAQGRIVHLGERECSVQRRHQKVIEESPSPIMTPELRRSMGEAAVRCCRASRPPHLHQRTPNRSRRQAQKTTSLDQFRRRLPSCHTMVINYGY